MSEDLKNNFLAIYHENIQRPGADRLVSWLAKTDFFVAPASTKYHLAHEGGLVEHSLHVYERFRDLCIREAEKGNGFDMPSGETIAICALLHDVCKADFYVQDFRNAKNEEGIWVKVPYYRIEDTLPYGHGEKSVYIINSFIHLSREEAFAIRWHMGGFDDAVKGGSYSLSKAFEMYPLALLLHVADLQATYLDEKE